MASNASTFFFCFHDQSHRIIRCLSDLVIVGAVFGPTLELHPVCKAAVRPLHKLIRLYSHFVLT